MDFPSIGCESSLRAVSGDWEKSPVDVLFFLQNQSDGYYWGSSRAGMLGPRVILSFAPGHITDISQLQFPFW